MKKLLPRSRSERRYRYVADNSAPSRDSNLGCRSLRVLFSTSAVEAFELKVFQVIILVMLTRYIQHALRLASYEILVDDQTFYGHIPGLDGVWANAPTLEACREELAEVLEEWLLFRLSRQLPIPPVDGIDLTIREVA